MTASEVIADHVPIALPRVFGGKVAAMMARLPGTRSAPPIPCSVRAAIRCRISGARPHQTDAAAKITMPAANMRMRPK